MVIANTRGRAQCTSFCVDFEQGTCAASFEGRRDRHFWWDPSNIYEPWQYGDDSGGGECDASRRYGLTPRMALADVLVEFFELDLRYALECIDAHAKREVKERCRCGCDEYIRQQKGPHLGLYCYACGKWRGWVATPLTKDEAESYYMPFGRYRGKRLGDCPDDYLTWIVSESTIKGKIRQIAQMLSEDRRGGPSA